MSGRAIVGISAKTRKAELVAFDDADNRKEAEELGLIIVPTSLEKARGAFCQQVDDIYALADDDPLRERLALHPEPLWCMHVQGPDDLYPAPSKEVAEIGAQVFNRLYGEKSESSGILMKAVVAPWPYSPESHAEEAAEFVETCILPAGNQGGAV
jgi:hypothetical protein